MFRAQTRGVEALDPDCMIVGAFSEASFQSAPLELAVGDLMVVYSDGLTEAENPAGKMFGEDRLRELICRFAPQGAAQLEEQIQEAIEDFTEGHPQTDDVTLMLVEKLA